MTMVEYGTVGFNVP